MPILIECAECGAKFRVGDGAAGKTLPCKRCGAEMRVPGRSRGGERQGRSGGSSRPAAKRRRPSEEIVDFGDDSFDDEFEYGGDPRPRRRSARGRRSGSAAAAQSDHWLFRLLRMPLFWLFTAWVLIVVLTVHSPEATCAFALPMMFFGGSAGVVGTVIIVLKTGFENPGLMFRAALGGALSGGNAALAGEMGRRMARKEDAEVYEKNTGCVGTVTVWGMIVGVMGAIHLALMGVFHNPNL